MLDDTGVSCAVAANVRRNGRLLPGECFQRDERLAKPVEVPSGFADATFEVPVPADGVTLYLKLRDDVGAVASLVVPKAVAAATSAPAAAADAKVPASVAGH